MSLKIKFSKYLCIIPDNNKIYVIKNEEKSTILSVKFYLEKMPI